MSGPYPFRPIMGACLAAYKFALSPVFMAFGARCRHEPSCSEYAAEAVSRHGIWPGVWMMIARLSRCRPGGSQGYDPPPDALRAAGRWYAPWRYGVWRGVFLSETETRCGRSGPGG